MSKRKQRSTAIRKRIEKKQREEQRAKRKAQKAAGAGSGEDNLLFFRLPRERVAACHAALADLEARLAQGNLRGWSPSDLQGDYGLAWFGRVLGESLESSEADPLRVEFFEQARHPLLERMAALELAASGLKLPWDEAGFDDLLRALNQAEEVVEEEEEEEEEVPETSEDEAAASGEEAASGDETASGDDPVA
ncbi:MAG: hypothetical protein M9894_33920 [Planctomycetes bacterium]|nr:hypothetical protein [Planctomycetota bacterium]